MFSRKPRKSKASSFLGEEEQLDLGIYSVVEFKRLLQRERARADRSGLGFSMLVFDLFAPGGNGNGDLSEELMRLLTGRVRLSDIVGWFDKNELGALLYDTPPEGAYKLGENILQNLSTALPYRVYTYPCEYLSSPQGVDSEEYTPVQGKPGNGTTQRQDPAKSAATLRCGSLVSEDYSNWGTETSSAAGLESVLAQPIPLWKRACDIFFASIGVALVFPLFLLLAAVVKSISPGPVIFRQQRIGYLGRPFTFWKLRTMELNTDSSKHRAYVSGLIKNEISMTKLDDADPQIIPYVGRFLRKSCLDELPQLVNVLRGDMSLIGPRPCLPYEYEEYKLWHKKRFDTLPGMTGLWQVSGKNRTTFAEMIRLDIAYEQQRSFWLDLKIIFRTFSTLFNQMTERHILQEG